MDTGAEFQILPDNSVRIPTSEQLTDPYPLTGEGDKTYQHGDMLFHLWTTDRICAGPGAWDNCHDLS